MPRESPRRRLILTAEAEREARRGDVALRCRCKVDVEVVVQEGRPGKAVEVEARHGADAGFHARIYEPVRGGAEELSTREVMGRSRGACRSVSLSRPVPDPFQAVSVSRAEPRTVLRQYQAMSAHRDSI